MTFQIISKETNEAINLVDFDNEYCTFNNIEPDKVHYAYWFYVMEGAFLSYGDIADHSGEHSLIHEQLVKDSRNLSMRQAVQALTIWVGRTFFKTETFEDWNNSVDWLKPVVKFFLSVEDKYYFTFRF